MTDPEQLYEQWQANKHRPAWVQENREDLVEVTEMWVPESRSVIATWLPDHKAPVTTKLKNAADVEPSETEAEADT